MKKQIEEMARIAADVRDQYPCRDRSCVACPYFKVDSSYCEDCLAMEAVYNAGYQKPEWIRVEDDLPKNDFDKPLRERKRYIVFTNSGTTSVVTYGYHEYDWWCSAGVVIKGVTHWMPLPALPKGE